MTERDSASDARIPAPAASASHEPGAPSSAAAPLAGPAPTSALSPADRADLLPDEELLYDLADLFRVFSDTTRIKILYALMGTELSVGDIAEETGSSQSAVSHQLRTLKQAHLVKFRRDGRNILYSLADDHVYTMLNQGMSHICE